MSVRIRLTRTGKKNFPFYRIGVFDSHTRRDGPYIENLGAYDPRQKDPAQKVKIDKERYEHWINQGARPTESVARLLKHTGVLLAK